MPKYKKGFSLIEIILAVGVVALLGAIVFVTVDPFKIFGKAVDSQRAQDVKTIYNSLSNYVNEGGVQGASTRSYSDMPGFRELYLSALAASSPTGNCPGGSTGSNLSNVSGAYKLDTTGSNIIDVSLLVQKGYLPKVLKDPKTNQPYYACFDTTNNSYVIYSPNVDNSTSIPFQIISNYIPTSNTYYVSSTGDDSNPGTSIAQAWKTINKVTNSLFVPGDTILFEGGQTFAAGGTTLNPQKSSGTATTPITYGSYGSGKATLTTSANVVGFYSYNKGGFTIKDLNFVGIGAGNTQSGISFYCDNGVYENINIINVDISGYGNGIALGCNTVGTSYKNVKITNSFLHDNLYAGMTIYSQNAYANDSFEISNNKIYNNLGSATQGGAGILMGGSKNSFIRDNTVYNNGNNCDASCLGGIVVYTSSNVIIERNESYGNQGVSINNNTAGISIDSDSQNCFAQYNYTHDNYGPGFSLSTTSSNTTHTGNVLRFNISQNDGRSYGAGSGILVYGSVNNAEIYNNTVYLTPVAPGSRAILLDNTGLTSNYGANIKIRNNIFMTSVASTAPSVEYTTSYKAGTTGVVFQGNDYFSTSGTFRILWGNSTYSNYTTWQNAQNQEKVNSVNVGFNVNPLLTSAGTAGTIGYGNSLTTLSQYKLQVSSTLFNVGQNMQNLLTSYPPEKNFYQTPITAGFNIGAY